MIKRIIAIVLILSAAVMVLTGCTVEITKENADEYFIFHVNVELIEKEDKPTGDYTYDITVSAEPKKNGEYEDIEIDWKLGMRAHSNNPPPDQMSFGTIHINKDGYGESTTRVISSWEMSTGTGTDYYAYVTSASGKLK